MTAAPAHLTAQPMRVLLIKDDVQFASTVSEYLREHEFQVTSSIAALRGRAHLARRPGSGRVRGRGYLFVSDAW